MPDAVGSDLLAGAVAAGFLSEKQASLLNEELQMFPGQNLPNLLVKRGLISPEQLKELQNPAPPAKDKESPATSAPQVPPRPIPATNAPGSASMNPPGAQQPVRPAPQGWAPPQPKPLGGNSQASTQSPYAVNRTVPPPATPAMSRPAAAPPPTAPRPVQPGPPTINNVVKINSANAALRPLPANATLADYLVMARQAGCSDLHLIPGRKPLLRKDGELIFLDTPSLSPERARDLNFSLLTNEQKKEADEHLQLEYAMEIGGSGRHRCNVFQQRVGWEGSYRIVPNYVPSLTDIDAPPVLQKLTEFHQGLILVTGPAGSGKTTTVAAMLDHINHNRHDHVITVEDPIEYVFTPDKCQITQREVGKHTDSFGVALRGALRQDPDVIMVGELRDQETTSIAISAAETGHLVFATLHTNNTIRTVARILDVYPVVQRAQICVMVAESLRGIISQQLIPRRDGKGRVSAVEILIFTTGVAQIVKEGKSHQLLSHMQSGKKQGMQIMTDSLMDLYRKKIISGKEAWAHAENKEPFESVKGES